MDTKPYGIVDNPAAAPTTVSDDPEISPGPRVKQKLPGSVQLRIIASARHHFPAVERTVREMYESIERGSPRAAMFFNLLPATALEFPSGMETLPEDVQIFLTRVLIVQCLWRDLEKFPRTVGLPNLPDLHIHDIDVSAVVAAYMSIYFMGNDEDGAEDY